MKQLQERAALVRPRHAVFAYRLYSCLVLGLLVMTTGTGVGCGDVSEPPRPPFGHRRPPAPMLPTASPSRFDSYVTVAEYNCVGPEHDLLVKDLDKREIDWTAGGTMGFCGLLVPPDRADEARAIIRKLAAQTGFEFKILESDPLSAEKGLR